MKATLIIFFSILFPFIGNLNAQNKISLTKSNWFFEITNAQSELPDTIELYRRTSYNLKIEKGVLTSDWLDDFESEIELFKHNNY